MRNDASDLRRARIQQINKMLVKNFRESKLVIARKFIALCQFNIGLSKKKVEDYIQILIDMDLCTIENGFIKQVIEE